MNTETAPGNGNSGSKSIRLLRPSIVVFCGPAGCGKSTFAKRHFRPTQIISSDWARAIVGDDERDQRYNAQAFALVHFLVEQRLSINRLCVVDSTALTAQSRRELLDLARKFQVPATLMLFNVPFETCVERDEKRERSVGRAVLERQYQSFEQTKEAVLNEGFTQVVQLQDGDLDTAHIEILFRPVQRSEPAPARRPDHAAQASWHRPVTPRDAYSTAVAQPAAAPRPVAVAAAPSAAAVASSPIAAPPQPVRNPAPAASVQSVSAATPAVSAPRATTTGNGQK